METASVLLHSTTVPFGFNLKGNPIVSCRHFSKRVQSKGLYPLQSLKPIQNPSSFSLALSRSSPTLEKRRTHLFSPAKCSFSGTSSSNSQNPLLKPLKSLSFDSLKNSQNPLLKPLKNLSFDSLKTSLSQLTPVKIVKWAGIASIAIAAAKWTVNLVFNPFFWMYFSWSWLFWPWFVAIALAFYGLYCFRKHSIGEASLIEQLAIVTSAFTWLTLVPPAYFNGYLEGWPFVFCFVYHYFFFFNVSVRKRMYGDYYVRPHDPKWDVNTPKWYRLLFCVGVMVGHWLAAFEGPELQQIPGGWNNVGIWILIVTTLLMQYNSTLYLAKYSEKVVEPTAVVQFGPYRWVRHPIYASTMLLFATYCIALRAPLSLLFLVAVCVMYYEQKAKLEEVLMVETFGEDYPKYASKVRYKFIPFVY